MKIEMSAVVLNPNPPLRVGNVYAAAEGRGLRGGHMEILIAVTEARGGWLAAAGLMLVAAEDGRIIGMNSHDMKTLKSMRAVAFVEGLESLTFTMRSL